MEDEWFQCGIAVTPVFGGFKRIVAVHVDESMLLHLSTLALLAT